MTFDEIVRMSQQTLKKALISELRHMGYRTITKQGFTYGAGTLPVLLVAHLDTVHRERVKTICYSLDRKIVMSPQGIGGDDRAGVFMILEIIKRHRCHVLFCEDEESGGIGATKFSESGILPKVNYIVELDRRGSNDAVFYDCDNPDFTNFICGFGFEEDFGTFSDVSIVAPYLGIAAVNISAGYYNEHTRHEHVNLAEVAQNIKRVGQMVSSTSKPFQYIEAMRFARRGYIEDRYFGELDWTLDAGDPTEVLQLKSAAEQFGVSEDEVDLLLDFGYDPDEIELLLNSPNLFQKAVCHAMFEDVEWG